MPVGLTLLVVVSILVLFGVGHRILDRMRLNDKTALLFLAAIFVGTLIPDIRISRSFYINIGGAVVPIILAIYLFISAGTDKERIRALFASILAGIAVLVAGWILPEEPENILFDPNYIYGIIAGLIAYLFGRSRRASFIAGISGVLLADIAQGILNATRNIPTVVRLGSAGAVDAVVISGFLAVILAEVLGEVRERLQGGTAKKDMRFNHAQFTNIDPEEEEGAELDEKK